MHASQGRAGQGRAGQGRTGQGRAAKQPHLIQAALIAKDDITKQRWQMCMAGIMTHSLQTWLSPVAIAKQLSTPMNIFAPAEKIMGG